MKKQTIGTIWNVLLFFGLLFVELEIGTRLISTPTTSDFLLGAALLFIAVPLTLIALGVSVGLIKRRGRQ